MEDLMEETISLNQIFSILKKRIGTIVIFAFIGLAISGIVTFFFITPKYSSQAQLVVTLPQTETTNANDVNTNLQMINTYKDFITSDLVLKEATDKLQDKYGLNMKTSEIKETISVEQNENSQMFSIVANTNKAQEAEQIANTMAAIFKDNAKDVLNVDRITIISDGIVDPTPVSPNNKINLAIGLVLGIVIGVALAFVAELLDRTVKDTSFVSDELGFTILGNVAELSDKDIQDCIKKAQRIPKNNEKTVERTSESGNELMGRRVRKRV
jgi:capsular polysaccharide biosynthesis protein